MPFAFPNLKSAIITLCSMLYASTNLQSEIRISQSAIENIDLNAPLCHTSVNHSLARITHESVSRDSEDGLATGQPQGVESEAYLNSTSQVSSPEDAREDDHIRGRSSRFMNYPG